MDLFGLDTDLKQWDRGFYRMTLFVPDRKRAAYVAVLHLFASLIRIVEKPHEPLLVPIRLQWWRDWLTDIYHQPQGGHGLAQEPILTTSVDFTVLDQLVEGFVNGWQFQEFSAAGAALFRLVEQLDGTDPSSPDQLTSWGCAWMHRRYALATAGNDERGGSRMSKSVALLHSLGPAHQSGLAEMIRLARISIWH